MSLYDSGRDNLVKWHFKGNQPSKDLTIDKLKQKFYRADFGSNTFEKIIHCSLCYFILNYSKSLASPLVVVGGIKEDQNIICATVRRTEMTSPQANTFLFALRSMLKWL